MYSNTEHENHCGPVFRVIWQFMEAQNQSSITNTSSFLTWEGLYVCHHPNRRNSYLQDSWILPSSCEPKQLAFTKRWCIIWLYKKVITIRAFPYNPHGSCKYTIFIPVSYVHLLYMYSVHVTTNHNIIIIVLCLTCTGPHESFTYWFEILENVHVTPLTQSKVPSQLTRSHFLEFQWH